MSPIAGVLIWIVFSALAAWFVGKMTATDGPQGLMTNSGVSVIAALVAGFAVCFFDRETPGGGAFWVAIVSAALASVITLVAFRFYFVSPRHP